MEMSITPNRCRTPDRGRQRGQSSVFVIVFLGITILSLIFLYKAGMLTNEKMEMQNAADGVAYSVAILEARDLNFMAYTNRAMVANEVAIGQAVGLASWPRHWEGVGHYHLILCGTRLEPIANALILLQAIPYVGAALKQIGQKIKDACQKGDGSIRKRAKADFIDAGSNLAGEVDDNIAVPLAQLMHKANEGLSDAQSIFHLGTIAYVTKIVMQVTQDNVTDNTADDTQLSAYGLAALLGHLYSFGHFAPYTGSYGSDPNRKDNPYIRTYEPSSSDTADTTGFERFAATTSAARDEFSKGPRRWWINPIFDPNPLSGGTTLCVPLVVCIRLTFWMTQGLATSIDKRGGSELRHAGNSQGDQYNWSSGDTAAGIPGYAFKAGFLVEFSTFPDTSDFHTAGGVDLRINLGDPVVFAVNIQLPIVGTIPISLTLPLGLPKLPMGAGAAQINASATNKIESSNLDNLPYSDLYGDAPAGTSVRSVNKPAHEYAWNAGNPIAVPAIPTGGIFFCPKNPTPVPIPCTVPVVSKWMPNLEIGGGYTGLKQYSDTTDADDLWGFEGPQIIIALEKQIDDIFSDTAPQPTGRFELIESSNTDDVIGAIAKGEVYFKRPSDMDLFRRWDTQKTSSGNSSTLYEEYGSAFNPYWQARLAPLSHADRAVATAQQHGQDLETGSTATQTITASWELDTWID